MTIIFITINFIENRNFNLINLYNNSNRFKGYICDSNFLTK